MTMMTAKATATMMKKLAIMVIIIAIATIVLIMLMTIISLHCSSPSEPAAALQPPHWLCREDLHQMKSCTIYFSGTAPHNVLHISMKCPLHITVSII